ncbi:MAG: hypothetical protein VX875_00775 [Pseudomonadota bacterium]|nr:hypothetical protein [Pseudomonadota bacterium]
MKLVNTLLITGLTTLSISAFAGDKIEQASATAPEPQLSTQADVQAPQGATVVSTQDTLAQAPQADESQMNQAAAEAQPTDKDADKVALEEAQDKKDGQ